MREELDLNAVKATADQASAEVSEIPLFTGHVTSIGWVGRYASDVPALVAEVERLRDIVAALVEEPT